MDVQELLSQARDGITVKRVFGEPYERNGVTVIPVARVSGGGGGGGGSEGGGEGAGEGWGTGFGLTGKPVGVYVIRDNDVSFEPVVDRGAVIIRSLGVLALLGVLLLRRR
jgi:uncharacterized spore protein YtfJ